jgi:hypothetical protein
MTPEQFTSPAQLIGTMVLDFVLFLFAYLLYKEIEKRRKENESRNK